MVSVGDVAAVPNGVGSVGRVVGVFPLYRNERGEDVGSVAYESLQDPAQRHGTASEPDAARPVTDPIGGVVGARSQSDSLLGAQEAADRPAPDGGRLSTDPADMSAAERAQLAQIQARDAAVRQEEEAHAAAAGPLAGAIQYQYQRGPDGRNYVVNGSVPISFGGAATDEQQAANLRRIQGAAIGVQSPSAADMQVFQQATGLQAASRVRAIGADGAASPDQGADPNRQDDPFRRDEQSVSGIGAAGNANNSDQAVTGVPVPVGLDPFADAANRSYRQAERLGLVSADRLLVDA